MMMKNQFLQCKSFKAINTIDKTQQYIRVADCWQSVGIEFSNSKKQKKNKWCSKLYEVIRVQVNNGLRSYHSKTLCREMSFVGFSQKND